MYFDPAGWLLRHPEMMGRSQYTSGEGCKGLRSTPEKIGNGTPARLRQSVGSQDAPGRTHMS